ncbi:MAG: YebC/PmpR family DNA-binding transcriptional regulator [bacterium]|nr:YebC/PmpR family DNA-binding transcriptional regulator [bacterium]
MSGHSKWATIHRAKEVTDAKRGQVFTKLANAIIVAVRAGGGAVDPAANFKLRLAVEKAREFNMPKENIARAIAKGSGEGGGADWEEIVYEGYGPHGIAIMIEAATDNKKRTASEIKNILEKGGGTLAGPGAVAFQFEKKGLIVVSQQGNSEEVILKIMDLGVDDIEEALDAIEIYTKPEEFEETKNKLASTGFTIVSSELVMKPLTSVAITDEHSASKIIDFLKKLEDQADVQRVFANFDIPQEILEKLG